MLFSSGSLISLKPRSSLLMNVWMELMFVNKQIIILIITLTGFKSLLEKKNGKKK